MKFFENDDFNTLRCLTVCLFAVVIVVAIGCYFDHLSDLHNEKMAQMGCNQKLINNYHIWECGKDKQ